MHPHPPPSRFASYFHRGRQACSFTGCFFSSCHSCSGCLGLFRRCADLWGSHRESVALLAAHLSLTLQRIPNFSSFVPRSASAVRSAQCRGLLRGSRSQQCRCRRLHGQLGPAPRRQPSAILYHLYHNIRYACWGCDAAMSSYVGRPRPSRQGQGRVRDVKLDWCVGSDNMPIIDDGLRHDTHTPSAMAMRLRCLRRLCVCGAKGA
jgi:hypothetical protein